MYRTPTTLLLTAASLAAIVTSIFLATTPSLDPSFPALADTPPAAAIELAASANPAAPMPTEDPLALSRRALDKYVSEVRDYRCTLTKQECVGGKLTKVQEIDLLYRASPKAVYMRWNKNADGARRALFKDDPSFVDNHGQKVARVEPNGAIARLFVTDILMPINGPEAKAASRRSIADAGFGPALELLNTLNTRARQRGELDLQITGAGRIDGRPTWILVRNLPYAGDNGDYPDARMVLHLDQQWLLPVAIYSYADRAQTRLLGSYVFTQVRLNPGLTDADFTF